MKRCVECHRSKPVSAFYRHPTYPDGRMHICKRCHRARMKHNRMTNPKVQERDCQRAKLPERRRFARATAVAFRNKHPGAYRAMTAVGNAIRDGRLKKGRKCSICSTKKNLQARHRSYRKPLDVVWLCARCNHRIRVTFPELSPHRRKSR